ncbi:hypothetical protein CXF86_00290 [Shewanella sp. GutCb]|uniref:hypothetical protein n=1 Tax=Shewanella sp. GutCb TaxID=2058315 RepID=UPI000C7D7E8E|nr:hypothetical protein [Shewanella sp. GutCb]PKG76563.1 hypothetical protein CXF86_00290 [Shewanella sp. GutCb]
MTLKKAVILGLLFSSTVSLPALAIDPIHAECATCQTETQFYTAARKNAVLNRTLSINIMNFENYELKKFRVSKSSHVECEYDNEPDGRGGKLQICRKIYDYSTISASITNEELNLFTDLADSINDARKYYSQRSIEIPSTVVESGYEIIGAGYVKTKVTNYFNQMPLRKSILEKAVVVGASASKMISTGIKFEMPALVFLFSDGVKAYATLDFYDMDDEAHFKFIKLVDKNGNSVDFTKSNPFSEKSYNFSGISQASWSVFHAAMSSYGLTVRGSSSKIVPRGTVTIVVCSSGKDNLCKSPN